LRERVQAALIEVLYLTLLLPVLPLFLFLNYLAYVSVVVMWIVMEWLFVSWIDKKLDERYGR